MNHFSSIKALDVFLGSSDPWLKPYCASHARFLDATGLCPTCQREAKEQAETRANNEAVRRIAVEAEVAVMAEMYQL